MEVLSSFSYQTLSSTKIGDLIRMPNIDGDHAIVLDQLSGNVTSVVTLSNEASRSFINRKLSNESCLNYGDKWQLNPIFSPVSGRKSHKFFEKPGVIHFCDAGYFITIKPNQDDFMSSIFYFNMSNNSIDNPPENCIPIIEWEIYSPASATSIGTEILRFKHQD